MFTSNKLAQPLTLGPFQLRNRLAVAPMAGLTDVPLRTQAWRLGAGYMVSEMVGSKPQLWDTGKSRQRRVPVPGVEPAAVQIAGFDPLVMAEAARAHVDAGAQVIDLNFGCPAKKVCKKAAGSALLADLDLIGRIVAAVAAAVPVPVTAKTRLGLSPDDQVGVQAARVIEDAGAAMLVIHARSRACRFVGPVDYAAVRSITENAQIPVLVNGDITDRQSAHTALVASGADGVMIGRAIIGQPWVIQEILEGTTLNAAERHQVITQQLKHMHEFYGELAGLRIARKHLQAYLHHQGWQSQVSSMMRASTAVDQLDLMKRLEEQLMAAA